MNIKFKQNEPISKDERTIPTSNIEASGINREVNRSNRNFFSMNDKTMRDLAGKPYGEIKFSDFRNKRFRDSYFLIGKATTSERGNTYDSGLYTETWNNVPRNTRIRTRVYATTDGSHKNDGTRGYVYVKWTFKDKNGNGLFSSVRIDKYTSGDGAGGIGQWAQEYRIQDLIGASDESVSVTIEKRFIAGDYQAHIGGGRSRARRIHGIESNVGF